jgi:hypothetical protein
MMSNQIEPVEQIKGDEHINQVSDRRHSHVITGIPSPWSEGRCAHAPAYLVSPLHQPQADGAGATPASPSTVAQASGQVSHQNPPVQPASGYPGNQVSPAPPWPSARDPDEAVSLIEQQRSG